ncbi:hypothetical protein JYG23_05610 [Sedimentibacter sp. zth1]|uniref:hypothetical protein n=1 Tax=Sedimentibacter sp. zth1 TaxID=2816908 RepID=UPI001A918A4A|nr:hypothetical protein [Sedimentibacter sp. zth1]QSX06916.1 hypothetical protein JYG23_05610 [Sedimentibacter sp. zth1]
MNTKFYKILSITVIIGLIFTGTVFVFAQQSDDKDETNKETPNNITNKLESILVNDEADKDETVYVIANSDGTAKKVIVSDWVKNINGNDKLNDKTDATNIVNVNGEEQYTMNDNNICVWDAEGKDIYYQGEIDKELPVTVSIGYKLDGKEISSSELVGKSGKVTMTFNYINNQRKTVSINGKNDEVYVPFVMLSGMVLDNTNFTNIKVSNGKIINDGDRSVVIGFALPGMQESLAIGESKLSIPNNVEITADVQDFSLETTITLATNDMFNHLDVDNINSLGDLENSLGELSVATEKLVNGSSDLYNGISLLLEKSNELIDGVNKLANGAKALSEGANSLNENTGKLKVGVDTLNSGLKELNKNSAMLNGGAEQVFNTLLGTAQNELAKAGVDVPTLTIENYDEILNGILKSLGGDNAYDGVYNGALKKVTDAVKANESVITEQVTMAVNQQVFGAVLEKFNMTIEQYKVATGNGQISQEVKAQIEGAVNAQMQSEEVKATITKLVSDKEAELINQQMSSEEMINKIKNLAANAENGQKSIKGLVEQLDTYKQFYDGVITYTSGVDKAYNGSNILNQGVLQLADGTEKLSSASNSLYEGITTLQDASKALIEGIIELQDGSMQLSNGMKQLSDEGINKLVSLVGDDVTNVVDRIKAVVNISKEYQNFGGISEDMTGKVKFIYRTEAIDK